MKTIIAIALVAIATIVQAEEASYKSGEINLEAFAVESTPDFGTYTGGYGVGVSYFYHRNFGIGVRAESSGWNFTGPVVERGSVALTGRLPLGALAPYGRIGAAYSFGSDRTSIETGLGVELRFGKALSVFTEAQVRSDLGGRSTYAGLAGIRIKL